VRGNEGEPSPPNPQHLTQAEREQFAKLEMYIIVATFAAIFDYTLEDPNGKPMVEVPPIPRSIHGSSMPQTPMRLRYKLRK